MTDALPPHLAGLYFGGGYPENHAQQLAANKTLMASVKAFAEAGGVVYAECGGLIYLSQSIQPWQELPVSMGMSPCSCCAMKVKAILETHCRFRFLHFSPGGFCNANVTCMTPVTSPREMH